MSKVSRSAHHRHIEPLELRFLLSVAGSPTQLSPAMIEQAYDLKSIVFSTGAQTVNANGAGETIAIVDAFGDPNISSDLMTFDSNFGIGDDNAQGQFVLTVATPQGAVTTDPGWANEESLDVEWAHAIAPEANILLVEASSSSVSNLTSAVNYAKAQSGVVAVSMSWGSIPDFADENADDPDFTTPSGQPGVTFIAASGDNGQPNYPSTSPNVLAVGGTTLTVDDSGNLIGESTWAGSGGGHSDSENTNKPDVAYDGNPNTGFLVYDSIPDQGASGWKIVGGTSAGAPQWAGIIALVDQGRALLSLDSLDGPTQAVPEIDVLPSSDFNDVTGGGLTGLGSPIGEKIISALVGGGITSVNAAPAVDSTKLAFGQQPSDIVAGNKISPDVTVSVEDTNGDVVMSDNSSVTISIAGGPGTLDGIFTVTAVNGVATFTNLSLNTAGSYTLQATDSSLSSTTSNTFKVNAAAATQLVFLQQPSDVAAGSPFSPAVAVGFEDQFGNTVGSGSSNVTLSLASGPGSLFGATAVGAAGGVATFNGLNVRTSGTYTLNATDGSLTHVISAVFTVSAASASKVIFAQQPSNVTAGSAIAPPVILIVQDQFGNMVTSDSSSVTLSTNTGPGAVSGMATIQVAGGMAVFESLSLDTAGSYTLKATDGSLTGATSNSFNATPAAASQLVFVQQPSNATAGVAISPAVTVEVEDPFGNVVIGDTSSVTVSVDTGPGPLGGNVSTLASNSMATFNDLSLNTAGSYTIQATDGGLASATSNSFSITPAAASQLMFVQQPTNLKSGGTIGPAVTVEVEDQFGNVVTSDTSNVAVAVASGPSSALSGTLTEQTVNGTASFGDLSLTAAGSYTLGASDGSLTGADSGTFVVGATVAPPGSPPTHLVFVQQTGALTAGAVMPSAFVVDVEDQFGDLVADNTSRVTLSVNGGSRGSAVHGAVTLAAVAGVATFSNVFLDVAGDYTFQVKDGKLAVGTSSTVVVNPAAPARLIYLQQPSNASAGNAINPGIEVELLDRFKNIATNDDASVTLSVLSGPVGAAISGTSSVAASNGVATFSDVLLETAGHYRFAASGGGLSAVSKPITILPGDLADVSFMQEPVNLVAGSQFDSRVRVIAADAFGNAAANGTVVTLGIQSGPAGGAILGKATAVVHKGIATFGNVTIQVPGDYVLAASADSISTASAMFSVLAPLTAADDLRGNFA